MEINASLFHSCNCLAMSMPNVLAGNLKSLESVNAGKHSTFLFLQILFRAHLIGSFADVVEVYLLILQTNSIH